VVMVWRLAGWFVLALVQRRVVLAGDLDRERATARLREGYASGQLTLDEFSRRTGRALSARSRWQPRSSLFGLSGPPLVDSVRDSVRPQAGQSPKLNTSSVCLSPTRGCSRFRSAEVPRG